jgi:hypothetical protein
VAKRADRGRLPDWVRGKGLALFATVFFGAMMAGSAIWRGRRTVRLACGAILMLGLIQRA